jgi:hypothetical protein
MKLSAVMLALGVLFPGALLQGALAHSPECRSIPDSGARLACYDRAAPPVAATARPVVPAVRASNPPTEGYVDSLSSEDARVNAQMKNICRGC